MTREFASASTVDEDARRRFEAAWNTGQPEPIEHFLPAEQDPHYLPTLKELVHIELEMAWKSWAKSAVACVSRSSATSERETQASPGHVEAYLARFPCLAEPSIVLQLLEQEYRVRRLYGDRPSPDEYCQRFPALVVTGREIEGTLAEESSLADDVVPIAGYQILGFLGRGGMGVVYKARQIRLNRLVALKMISAGAGASDKELARFHTEAEAVARLQHPNIVQIYEVGECRGRPYLALEFVAGGTLAQHLSGAPQPAGVSAQHLVTLARAISAAHQRGIVHRDLKPANILLSTESKVLSTESEAAASPAALITPYTVLSTYVPKITDFGLAKLLDSESGQTSTGVPLGTPCYMAPEQALGRTSDISPATDIYALGAILYELLTGRPPFRGETALSTMEQIRTQEPVPPTRLHPKVPRDLETICLKCLEKEPRRRYVTAEDFAQDVQRFLNGEAIRARPTPVWERGFKWAKRRPAVAALLGVSGGAALALLSVILVATARLQQQRDEAVSARADAQESFRQARDAVDQMLTRVAEQQLPGVPQMEQARRLILEDALGFYQRFLQRRGTDPDVRRETARAYRRVADIHMMLGQHPQAEQEYLAAVALQEELTADFPAALAYRQDLADSHNNLGNLLSEVGRAKEAESAHRQALAVREKLASDFPKSPACREQLAASYHNLGCILEGLSTPQARSMYEEALARQEKLVADFPDKADYQNDLARICANLGQLLRIYKEYPEAERLLRRSIDLKARLAASAAGMASHRFELANTYNNLGLLLWDMEQDQNAEQAYGNALAVLRKLATDFPSVPDYQSRLGGVLHNVAEMELTRKEWPKARLHLEEAIQCQKTALASNPRNVDYRRFFRNHLDALAETFEGMGEHAALARAASEAVRLFPDDAQEYVGAAALLARCVPLALKDDGQAPERRTGLADRYAAEAMRLLRDAIQRGYRDLKYLKENAVFDCLRRRDDFQKLLQSGQNISN